jgi:tetratricopeptide (TPR) repeat protein
LAAACLAALFGTAPACGGGSSGTSDEVPLPSLVDVDADVVRSIRELRQAVLDDPRSGEAWGTLGDRYYVHEFFDEAARCYEVAERLDPTRFVWPYRLGLSTFFDQPERSLAPLERSLRLLENYAPAREVMAQVLIAVGREDEAVEHLVLASRLDKQSPHAEVMLGQIELARGNLEAAREHFESAVARDKRATKAHVGLSQVYTALGQEKRGQHHADVSRTLPPSSRRKDMFATPNLPPAGARARTRYGNQLEKQGKDEEAAEQYRLALATNPDCYPARWCLAKLLTEAGRREEAIGLLREAEERSPTHLQVRVDLETLLDPSRPLEDRPIGDE